MTQELKEEEKLHEHTLSNLKAAILLPLSYFKSKDQTSDEFMNYAIDVLHKGGWEKVETIEQFTKNVAVNWMSMGWKKVEEEYKDDYTKLVLSDMVEHETLDFFKVNRSDMDQLFDVATGLGKKIGFDATYKRKGDNVIFEVKK